MPCSRSRGQSLSQQAGEPTVTRLARCWRRRPSHGLLMDLGHSRPSHAAEAWDHPANVPVREVILIEHSRQVSPPTSTHPPRRLGCHHRRPLEGISPHCSPTRLRLQPRCAIRGCPVKRSALPAAASAMEWALSSTNKICRKFGTDLWTRRPVRGPSGSSTRTPSRAR